MGGRHPHVGFYSGKDTRSAELIDEWRCEDADDAESLIAVQVQEYMTGPAGVFVGGNRVYRRKDGGATLTPYDRTLHSIYLRIRWCEASACPRER